MVKLGELSNDFCLDCGRAFQLCNCENRSYMPNATSNLWRSTSDFFLRFLNRYPPIMDQLRVMHEEELEVTQAALTQPENLPAEVADLIVTAMGLMMSLGFTVDDLNDAMLKVAAKNDAKTLESHEINSAGKIARKVKP